MPPRGSLPLTPVQNVGSPSGLDILEQNLELCATLWLLFSHINGSLELTLLGDSLALSDDQDPDEHRGSLRAHELLVLGRRISARE